MKLSARNVWEKIKMTNKQMDKFQKLFEEEIRKATMRGLINGFRSAFDTMIIQINNGMSLEELKAWAQHKKIDNDNVEKVMLDNQDNK